MKLKNPFKKKELTQQSTIQIEGTEAEARAEEKRLYEERREVLVQEYKALYPTAIIIIKDFQDYGTQFSFTRTVQTAVISDYSKWYYERNAKNDELEAELKNIKLINNSFDKEIHKLYTKKGFSFYKSDKECSYYHFYECVALTYPNGSQLGAGTIYLNEHDWNILTGKK